MFVHQDLNLVAYVYTFLPPRVVLDGELNVSFDLSIRLLYASVGFANPVVALGIATLYPHLSNASQLQLLSGKRQTDSIGGIYIFVAADHGELIESCSTWCS